MRTDIGAYIHNSSYNGLMRSYDKQDEQESKVNQLSQKLYSELTDDSYHEIESLIRTSLGWDLIDPDHVQDAIKSICDKEAQYRIKTECNLRGK
ncbi:hypothetical protein [Orbus mooreae]|uniref:hypothetical protein n=1 Tax=Orbus mooreae TaxID=3074107 RepID=UPI00370D49D7